MKKMIFAVVLFMVQFFSAVTPAQAQAPFDLGMCQRDASNVTCTQLRYFHFPSDGSDCIGYLKGSLVLPGCAAIGNGLALSSGVLSATTADYNTLVNVPATFTPSAHFQPFSSITGTPTTCSGYGITDCPTVPVINRARITTATDGTYTWTYPTACPASTIPIIQVTPEGSASTTYNTVIVGTPTNTAASIKITQVTDIVLLTIHVLGVAPASATVVHLTAVCP